MAPGKFDAALQLIYRAGMDPAQWPTALAAISDHVGATGALIANHNLELDEGLLIASRLRPDLSDLYVERYGNNPYSTKIKDRSPGMPVAGSDLVDAEEIRRTEFFADIFEPQRIVNHVMIGHHGMMQGADTGGLAVMLDARAADRIDDVLCQLTRLAPHICSALDLSLAVQRARPDRQDVVLLLEALSTPALLLDRAGRVVHANCLAEALMAERGGPCLDSDGKLTFSPVTEDHVLRGMIGRAVAIADGSDQETGPLVARLRRGPGVFPLLACVTPLPLHSRDSWPTIRAGNAFVLVRLMVPPSAVTLRTDVAMRLFDLTSREAKVATMVAAGLTMPQIARELDLSPATVRTYLTRCFDKTSVRSQSALAHLLASLPHALNLGDDA